ncbi:hypothetical protein D3C87_1516180 [compost metagenome]
MLKDLYVTPLSYVVATVLPELVSDVAQVPKHLNSSPEVMPQAMLYVPVMVLYVVAASIAVGATF